MSIKDSHVVLENFEVFAHNDSPLNISGSIDFADLSRMMVNVRMRASNYLLIDSKENARSEAYGKALSTSTARRKDSSTTCASGVRWTCSARRT